MFAPMIVGILSYAEGFYEVAVGAWLRLVGIVEHWRFHSAAKKVNSREGFEQSAVLLFMWCLAPP